MERRTPALLLHVPHLRLPNYLALLPQSFLICVGALLRHMSDHPPSVNYESYCDDGAVVLEVLAQWFLKLFVKGLGLKPRYERTTF